MDTIVIQMLGGFHVYVGDQSADAQINRSPKGRLLMQRLMLSCGETVSANELQRVLGLRGGGALKTLVSRTRSLLTEVSPELTSLLATTATGYCWSESKRVEIDFLRFEHLAQSLQTCQELTPVTRAMFDAAMTLYRGELLPDLAEETWVAGHAASLRALYQGYVQRYLNLLQAEGDVAEMVRVCCLALAILPFSDALRLRMADVMIYANRVDDPDADQLKTRLLSTGETLDESLAQLKEDLTRPLDRRAVICDASLFRDASRLLMRNLQRVNVTLCMGLLSVRRIDGSPLPPLTLDLVVDDLVQLLADGLRRSDVVSRIAQDQVAVLLPTATLETARVILERLMRQFFLVHSPEECLLSCRTLML